MINPAYAHASSRTFNRIFLLLMLVLVIYLCFFSWHLWQKGKSNEIQSLQNIMMLGARAIDSYVKHLEDCLYVLNNEISADERIDFNYAYYQIRQFKKNHTELKNISLIRSDGKMMLTAEIPPERIEPITVQSPSFLEFIKELQQGRPLKIGQPVQIIFDQEWAIPIRFTIEEKESKTIYIVAAHLPITFLENLWKELPFTKTGALGLIRDDGFLVARHPLPQGIEMKSVYGEPRKGTLITYLKNHHFPQNGYVEGPSKIDGPNFFHAFHRLNDFPITLFIVFPLSELWYGWWDQVKTPYILFAFIVIGGFFVYRMLYRQERDREIERNQAIETLSENEHKFRSLFERNSAVMMITDPNMQKIVLVNQAGADFYGWPIEKLSGKALQDIVETAPEELIKRVDEILSSGSAHWVSRHRKADHSLLDVEVFSCSIEINEKKYVYSIIQDITDRRKAENELQESEEKYRALFHNELFAIYILDTETFRFLDVNQSFVNLYGYSKEELIGGMTVIDITVQKQETETTIQQAISTGTLFIPLRYHRKKDGDIFPVEIVGGPHIWKGKSVIFAILHDISERIRTETELKETKLAYDEMVTQVPVGIYNLRMTADEDMHFEYISPRFCSMLDVTCEEVLKDANVFYLRIHPEDTPLFIRAMKTTKKNDIPFQWEGRFVIHEETRYMLLSSVPKRLENGDIIWTGTLRDVTRDKFLEAEKDQLKYRLQQTKKVESLGRMAGAIAHLFNNQLFIVIGNLEYVLNDLPLGSYNSEKLIDALTASHQAAETSKLMLAYIGQSPGNLERQDLSEACHRGLLMVHAFIPRNITVEQTIPFPGPIVRVNVKQFHQILTNLMTNAWESIGDARQGIITLSVKTVSAADIPELNRFPISWQPKEDYYACLEIIDTGTGIPQENIEKIFDPFFSSKFVGRGLGLSVVLGILGTHGGAITVENVMRKGAAFRVFLPLYEGMAPVALKKTERPDNPPVGGMVLLVEDQDQVRNMARAMISRMGFNVLEAKDGMEAVEIFQNYRDKIRFVISDLTMPRMNGWETLTALRKISPEIPVILSSGYDEAQVMAEEHADRPDAFLGKPYQLKELRQTVDYVLSAQKGGFERQQKLFANLSCFSHDDIPY